MIRHISLVVGLFNVMPKICDPPPFYGGQTANIPYIVRVQYTRNGDIYLDESVVLLGKIHGLSEVLTLAPNNNPNRTRIGISILYDPVDANNGAYGVAVFNYFNYETIINTLFTVTRVDGIDETGNDPPQTNCRCSDDSCRVDCANSRDGFCCIDHSVTNRLLQQLQNS